MADVDNADFVDNRSAIIRPIRVIRPGLAADLIAMPANPLDDLRALHDVSFVMKDGVVFLHDR